MNFLAHAYLSFGDADTLAGNMISDFVKGRKKFDYPLEIQHGINLHRAIDTFTDAHSATREAIFFLKPAAGLYAGAFIDIVYDHFLANDENQFSSDEALQNFSARTYQLLNKNIAFFPEPFAKMFPYMQSQNWLYNYKNLWGTKNSFGGLVRRAKYLDDSEKAFQLFEEHYSELQECYNEFFPAVKDFAYAKWIAKT